MVTLGTFVPMNCSLTSENVSKEGKNPGNKFGGNLENIKSKEGLLRKSCTVYWRLSEKYNKRHHNRNFNGDPNGLKDKSSILKQDREKGP